MSKPIEVALALISRKSYHSLELAKKLQEKGVAADEIPPLLEKLQKDGYLNDPDYEERFLESFIRKGKGVHLLGAALLPKGLMPLFHRLKARVLEGERSALKVQIQKFKGDLSNHEDKRRLVRKLQGKGFQLEPILEALGLEFRED